MHNHTVRCSVWSVAGKDTHCSTTCQRQAYLPNRERILIVANGGDDTANVNTLKIDRTRKVLKLARSRQLAKLPLGKGYFPRLNPSQVNPSQVSSCPLTTNCAVTEVNQHHHHQRTRRSSLRSRSRVIPTVTRIEPGAQCTTVQTGL